MSLSWKNLGLYQAEFGSYEGRASRNIVGKYEGIQSQFFFTPTRILNEFYFRLENMRQAHIQHFWPCAPGVERKRKWTF